MGDLQQEIRKFFWDTDVDRSGTISMDELRDALKNNGYKLTPEKLTEYFESFDTDSDGQISFDEYLQGMGNLPDEVHRYAELWRVYKAFDTDGDGSISKVELALIFKHMGKKLTPEQLDDMMLNLDKDNSGFIEFDEFIVMFEGKDAEEIPE